MLTWKSFIWILYFILDLLSVDCFRCILRWSCIFIEGYFLFVAVFILLISRTGIFFLVIPVGCNLLFILSDRSFRCIIWIRMLWWWLSSGRLSNLRSVICWLFIEYFLVIFWVGQVIGIGILGYDFLGMFLNFLLSSFYYYII